MGTGGRLIVRVIALLALGSVLHRSDAQGLPNPLALPVATSLVSDSILSDTAQQLKADHPQPSPTYHNVWGLDILISNDGFGLGTFYRREFSSDLFGFASFSISESKDEREFERFDPFVNVSFTPGKLRRFLVMPLLFGVQYRLFREDITETFRPYVNVGAGPTMIYSAPFAEIRNLPNGGIQVTQIEFFKSLGKGQPHYTLGSFIGFGAYFGSDKSSVVGVNFRYYFTYILGDGLPSLFNENSGEIIGKKKDFGGFFITLTIGMAY